ncbi:hypothetical protein ACFLYA_01240 [Candidatus Dependentiae bacterium]
MKINNIIMCTVFISSFFSYMHGMNGTEKNDKKKKKITHGQKVYNNMVFYIKHKKIEKEKSKMVQHISSEVIDCALRKAELCKDKISEELAPYFGEKASKVLSYIPVFNYVGSKIFDYIINLEQAKKERGKIKIEMEEILNKSISEKIDLSKKEVEICPWFKEKCNEKQQDQGEMCFDMLCVLVCIAKKHKEAFKKILEIGDIKKSMWPVTDDVPELFYNKIVESTDIEEKIERSCFKNGREKV